MPSGPVPFRRRGIIEARRDDISRVRQMEVKVTRVTGYVLISHEDEVTSAEASVDLPFPVVFTEKPVFTYGSELDANHRPLAGEYPTFSATVVNWDTVGALAGATEGRYTAATVVVVTSGQAGQAIWLHYSFEGKAIRNPLSSLEDLGDL